jgi:hyperosmotically inducible protein
MNTPQLLPAILILALCTAVACSREETNREAREAAAEFRTAAGEAGDRLADSWLTTKVQAQYFADEDIKSRYINVTTRDGVVTVDGYVESDDVRQEALQIARSTDGVRQVDDQLLIGRAPADAFGAEPDAAPVATGGDPDRPTEGVADTITGPIDDARVTTMIQAKYFLDSTVKGRRINVDTADGVVTLRGEVASEDERAQALGLARATEGVRRVEDALTVDAGLAPSAPARVPVPTGTTGAHIEDAVLAGNVRATLAADSSQDETAIDVSAKDGVVLLQGTVSSEAAKARALTAARGMEGVVQVVDRLSVAPRP